MERAREVTPMWPEPGLPGLRLNSSQVLSTKMIGLSANEMSQFKPNQGYKVRFTERQLLDKLTNLTDEVNAVTSLAKAWSFVGPGLQVMTLRT